VAGAYSQTNKMKYEKETIKTTETVFREIVITRMETRKEIITIID
jgi:hypothetical protein